MGGGTAAARRPVVALPVDEVGGRLVGHALPPDVAVVGEGDVGEDGVAVEGVQGGGVGPSVAIVAIPSCRSIQSD